MSQWQDVAHFLYGRGFWYADPIKEIDGLKQEHLYWTPDPKGLCILWHAGHIAHRERTHIGKLLEGIEEAVIPPQFEVFGTEWCSTEKIRESVESVESVLAWVSDVREKSHAYIATLSDEAFLAVPETSHRGLSVAHWLFITASHTALHIGRIQLLRALIESTHERAC